jgi:hypothetical protein
MMTIHRNLTRLLVMAAAFAFVLSPAGPVVAGWLDGVKEMKIGKETHPVCPEDYLIKRGLPVREVPDEENAAIEYVKAMNLYVEVPGGLEKIHNYVLTEPWIEEAKALVPWLEKNAAAIATIREGAKKKDCKFPLFGTPGMPVMGVLLPHLSVSRALARLLVVEGAYLEHQNKYREALDMYLVAAKMGYHVSKEPFLISGLVGIACDAMAARAIERCILRNRLDTATLSYLRDNLDGIGKAAESYEASMASERAFGISTVDDLFNRPSLFYEAFRGGEERVSRLKQVLPVVPGRSLGLRAIMKSDFRRYWNVMDEWIQLPDHIALRPENRHDQEFREDLPPWSLGRMLLPALDRARISFVRNKATTAILTAQVALEMYRNKEGEYPQKLDQLKGILGEIPVDPFTNEPLKYRRTEEGYVVYSVGEDLRDDGGKRGVTRYEPDIVGRYPLPPPKPFEARE